jgi:hypothetical protein
MRARVHRPSSTSRSLVALVALSLATCLSRPLAAQQASSATTSEAVSALLQLKTACAHDAGRMWGMSICGPTLLVDPESRVAIASVQPAVVSDSGDATFQLVDGVYLGHVPPSLQTANTSTNWRGVDWAMILLPLSYDPFARLDLLAHESFHRIQPALHLGGRDPMNAHLDTEAGRTWLRLEVRALAHALRATGEQSRASARDAMLFRAYRHSLFPKADSIETLLEFQEGLPEYTGSAIALAETHESMDHVAREIEQFEDRPTYVRSFAYATGPGLGLLLDRFKPNWRRTVQRDGGMAKQLARALSFTPPHDLKSAAEQRARAYGGVAVMAAEAERASRRATMLASYRKLLVDGPVLRLPAKGGMSRAFNPNNLFAFDTLGTVYPTGTFGGPWGKVVVDGAALVLSDYSELILSAPKDTSARPLKGDGWTFEIADGWTIRPDARAGDYEVVKTP